ncbi:NAD(P)-dependent oxidoreductase [Streptomyces sp. DH37]|uniref:NAD(P)-dependent oxidoreductase n=1 Tax=Streptomyces sp. DH37 TaxID=3040122 RepID=UPI002442E8CF|nr:NAD(P)-dependent oxidoreductase [Streptomyces sp. DH37]MDG9704180.1 NAD(P)-dependent oxidoreductase [Streptomyces sp. DH37]
MPPTGPSPAGPAAWADLDVRIAHSKMAPRLVPVIEGEPGIRLRVSEHVDADDADVLIGFQFPPGSLEKLERLRWLHLTGTGVDHLRAAGLRPGVLVTNSAAVPVTAVAEYALSGLLLLLKDLPEVVARQDAAWYRSGALLLSGSTVAVVGAGKIGRAVLRRLTALGARTVAVTRTGEVPVEEAERTVPASGLAREASGLDHLVACLPATPRTRGLIGAEVLAALPPHATVVNVGRAETVDNEALHASLREGRLRGAFVDVHEREPLPADDPVWLVPRLIVSPHRAFAFPGEPAEVARTFLANLHDLKSGLTPRDLVPWPAEGNPT